MLRLSSCNGFVERVLVVDTISSAFSDAFFTWVSRDSCRFHKAEPAIATEYCVHPGIFKRLVLRYSVWKYERGDVPEISMHPQCIDDRWQPRNRLELRASAIETFDDSTSEASTSTCRRSMKWMRKPRWPDGIVPCGSVENFEFDSFLRFSNVPLIAFAEREAIHYSLNAPS